MHPFGLRTWTTCEQHKCLKFETHVIFPYTFSGVFNMTTEKSITDTRDTPCTSKKKKKKKEVNCSNSPVPLFGNNSHFLGHILQLFTLLLFYSSQNITVKIIFPPFRQKKNNIYALRHNLHLKNLVLWKIPPLAQFYVVGERLVSSIWKE